MIKSINPLNVVWGCKFIFTSDSIISATPVIILNMKAHFRCYAPHTEACNMRCSKRGVWGIKMQMMRGYKLIWVMRVRAAAFDAGCCYSCFTKLGHCKHQQWVPNWSLVFVLTNLEIHWEYYLKLTKCKEGANLMRMAIGTLRSTKWLHRFKSLVTRTAQQENNISQSFNASTISRKPNLILCLCYLELSRFCGACGYFWISEPFPQEKKDNELFIQIWQAVHHLFVVGGCNH